LFCGWLPKVQVGWTVGATLPSRPVGVVLVVGARRKNGVSEAIHRACPFSCVYARIARLNSRLWGNPTHLLTGDAAAGQRRNPTFTPRRERGRASNFAGDSATAERSAGQHPLPTGVPPRQPMRFRAKLTGSLRASLFSALERQAWRALYGYTSNQDSEKDSTCST